MRLIDALGTPLPNWPRPSRRPDETCERRPDGRDDSTSTRPDDIAGRAHGPAIFGALYPVIRIVRHSAWQSLFCPLDSAPITHLPNPSNNGHYTTATCVYYTSEMPYIEYPGGVWGYPRAWNGGSITHTVEGYENGS
jgi:hypothetical protein